MTDEQMVEAVARAITNRAFETASADESEHWFAEQFAKAAIAAMQPYLAKAREDALEEAARECETQQKVFLSPEYAAASACRQAVGRCWRKMWRLFGKRNRC